ncbi:hypothetical protein PO124_09230 [Bacillus licheniformis]|nr:hypothetical protein [Bacillus licheniformis]
MERFASCRSVCCQSSGLLQDLDRQIVTLLYQPLIGSFRSACFSRCGESWSKTESGEKLDSQTADGGDADQPEDDSLRKESLRDRTVETYIKKRNTNVCLYMN